MLLNPRTFGQGYNVGMTQYYTDEWFVDTIAAIAASGVDYVSVGRLTQSAPAADIGLDFTPL